MISEGIEFGASVDADAPAIHLAARAGDAAGIERACLAAGDLGTCVGQKWVNDATALHVAAQQGHLACVERLLGKGADRLSCDAVGLTPLHYSVLGGCGIDVVQALLTEDRSNMDATSAGDETPLLFAAWAGLLPGVEALIGCGAAAGLPDKCKVTPLHLACVNGHVECVRVLAAAMAKAGSAMDGADEGGLTAEHVAGLLTQGVPGVPWDPFAPPSGPRAPSPDSLQRTEIPPGTP
jgi:ankyrin repeat protein